MDITTSPALELALVEALQRIHSTVNDENSRRLTLRVLLLRRDNDALHDELKKATRNAAKWSIAARQVKQEQICHADLAQGLHKTVDDLQRQLGGEKKTLQLVEEQLSIFQQNETKLQGKLSIAEVDLAAKERDSVKARKTLEQDLKDACSREVNTQRDLDHLRNKFDSMKRELEDSQAALTTEKKKHANTPGAFSGRITHCCVHVDDSECKLTGTNRKSVNEDFLKRETEYQSEKKSLESSCNDLETKIKLLSDRETELEQKVGFWRSRFLTAKEQLEVFQHRLSDAEAIASTKPLVKPDKTSQKHSSREASVGHGSPAIDGVLGRGKRIHTSRKRPEQTALVEKSMFSITPYLNRTVNAENIPVPCESMRQKLTKVAIAEEHCENPFLKRLSSLGTDSSSSLTLNALALDSSTPDNVLVEVKNYATNSKLSKKPRQIRSRGTNTLERVEEVNERERTTVIKESFPLGANSSTQGHGRLEAGALDRKVKKRKLGNNMSTLFDEDDVSTKRAGTSRTLSTGKLSSALSASNSGLGNATSFGTFSPLKRDRRGINASFLG